MKGIMKSLILFLLLVCSPCFAKPELDLPDTICTPTTPDITPSR